MYVCTYYHNGFPYGGFPARLTYKVIAGSFEPLMGAAGELGYIHTGYTGAVDTSHADGASTRETYLLFSPLLLSSSSS